VLTRKDIRDRIDKEGDAALRRTLREITRENTSDVYADEPLRVVVYRMAETGFTRMPVVDRVSRKFLGLISLDDLLKARTRHLEEERRRERTLKLRFFLPGGRMAEEKDISANP
jgi:CBS domain containing-hemolysin-like protein